MNIKRKFNIYIYMLISLLRYRKFLSSGLWFYKNNILSHNVSGVFVGITFSLKRRKGSNTLSIIKRSGKSIVVLDQYVITQFSQDNNNTFIRISNYIKLLNYNTPIIYFDAKRRLYLSQRLMGRNVTVKDVNQLALYLLDRAKNSRKKTKSLSINGFIHKVVYYIQMCDLNFNNIFYDNSSYYFIDYDCIDYYPGLTDFFNIVLLDSQSFYNLFLIKNASFFANILDIDGNNNIKDLYLFMYLKYILLPLVDNGFALLPEISKSLSLLSCEFYLTNELIMKSRLFNMK